MALEIVKICRPGQWYKNLMIFLPIIFVKELFNYPLLLTTFAGFISLSLMSSVNYIINDIADIKKDRIHPEKRNRPLASGKIKISTAIITAIILFVTSFAIAFKLSTVFHYFVLILFILGQLYSFWLKHEAFADVIVIGVDFVIRAMSGAYLINIKVSPWLILCPFFLALFLATGKRYADLSLLKEDAKTHKKTLTFYFEKMSDSLMNISTTLLIMCYALFSFLSEYPSLIYSLPIAIYIIFRYSYLIKSGSIIARKTHHFIFDIRLVITTIVWLALVMLAIYVL